MGLLLECCLILLAWSCTVLVQLMTAAESSLVQPPCYVWTTAAYCIPPQPLAPFLPCSLSLGAVGLGLVRLIEMSHLEFNTQELFILSTLTGHGH